MQAAPVEQEGPGPGLAFAAVPPVSPKNNKAKQAKPKPVASLLVLEHQTRTSERSNKGVSPSTLEFQSAILIVALLLIFFETAFGQDVINLPVY